MKKVIILVNDLSFFLSHRVEIGIALLSKGFKVIVAAPNSPEVEKIKRLGFTFQHVPFNRSGQNPIKEFHTLSALFRLLKKEKPELVHLITIKPVLYGGVISRLVGIKSVVAAVSGLGTVFVATSTFAKLRLMLVKALYRAAFKSNNIEAIFQNPDDRDVVTKLSGLDLNKTRLIRGSGVALRNYPYTPEPEYKKTIVVMAARLLSDKGVYEYIEAARTLKQRSVEVECRLIGSIDPGNKTSLTQEEFDLLKSEGLVKMLGFRTDIAAQYSQAHIVCLPSYREGLPKGLIEAAACGRAVVTTDVAGCRDAITPNETGLLVPIKSSLALANAIEYLVNNPIKRSEMGKAGRKLAESEFTVEHVVEQHLKIYWELLANA